LALEFLRLGGLLKERRDLRVNVTGESLVFQPKRRTGEGEAAYIMRSKDFHKFERAALQESLAANSCVYKPQTNGSRQQQIE
jgi:hypothetical protein